MFDYNVLLEDMKRARAKQDGVEFGFYKCDCGEVRAFDDAACPCEEVRRAQRDLDVRRSWLSGAYNSIPSGMAFCRQGDKKWESLQMHPKARELANKWNRKRGNVLLLGDTGAGKTVSVVALMHRILDKSATKGVSVADHEWAKRMRFVSCPALAVARRNTGLGAEAALVETAMQASLLVLDELGFEVFEPTRDTTLFEVLNHRYMNNSLTIVTSGRRESELKERYGAAMLRRITERGLIVNLWSDKQ